MPLLAVIPAQAGLPGQDSGVNIRVAGGPKGVQQELRVIYLVAPAKQGWIARHCVSASHSMLHDNELHSRPGLRRDNVAPSSFGQLSCNPRVQPA
jgi:hypothetical protein